MSENEDIKMNKTDILCDRDNVSKSLFDLSFIKKLSLLEDAVKGE